jgi:hypothetical protein
MMDDGALVLGNVELKDQALILSVNSQARADQGRALLSEVLDGLVGQPLVEMQTLEQRMRLALLKAEKELTRRGDRTGWLGI